MYGKQMLKNEKLITQIKEIQIKTIMRHYFSLVKIATIKRS